VSYRLALALVSGTIFGAGLALSGMMDPSRVRGFLDLFGAWDPTLAFVMGGALAVMAIAWLVQKRMERPLADARFSLPASTTIDARLVAGSAIFGMGWGLAGLCPGPALASLVANPARALTFVVAMVAGMALFHLADEFGIARTRP